MNASQILFIALLVVALIGLELLKVSFGFSNSIGLLFSAFEHYFPILSVTNIDFSLFCFCFPPLCSSVLLPPPPTSRPSNAYKDLSFFNIGGDVDPWGAKHLFELICPNVAFSPSPSLRPPS